MRTSYLAFALTACVVGSDGGFIAGDDLDNEDTTVDTHAGGPVTFADYPDHVDWHNDQGTFRIYKTCLGPNPGASYIGHDGTVGPGYVAIVWNRKNQIVVDDTAIAAHIGPNGGILGDNRIVGATGLGLFGMHLLRKPVNAPSPFTIRDLNPDGSLKVGGANHAWQISGRWCNANRRPDDYGGYRGYGARSWSSPTSGYYIAPVVVANQGQFGIEVTLGDAFSDLVTVRYTYRIGSNYVKSWVRVTNVCSDGKCDELAAGGDAFVKEPKVIAGVNPANPNAIGYEQMNIFNDAGHTATSGKNNKWNVPGCSASPQTNNLCDWGAKNPRAEGGGSTGQCNDPTRRRARFWNPQVSCGSDPSCLVVAARGADTELGTSYAWQGAHGLDLWAQRNVSEGREQADPQDSKADGYLERGNCYNNSAALGNRRWEMMGFDKDAQCSYTVSTVAFHGWEGGTGAYDCEPLYYRMGHSPTTARESYVVALSFGFGAAPLP